jgi:hypothetical protein
MDDDRPPEPQPQIEIYLPNELEPGVYSNMLAAWYTADEFTLDFAALQRPRETEYGDAVAWARVVTRVKVPTSGIFEMIRIMNEVMTRYERTFGEIRPPGDEA